MDGEAIDSSEKDRLILAHLFRNEHIEAARSEGLNNFWIILTYRRIVAVINK